MADIRAGTMRLSSPTGARICEDCGAAIKVGDEITFTTDMDRWWHTNCFNAHLTPFRKWPRRAAST